MNEREQRLQRQLETAHSALNKECATVAALRQQLAEKGEQLAAQAAELERMREEMEKNKFVPEPQEEARSPRDWRIGLTVKPRLRSDELYYERGTVTDVLKNGTGGIDDKDGVFCIRMESGNVILRRAGDWTTA